MRASLWVIGIVSIVDWNKDCYSSFLLIINMVFCKESETVFSTPSALPIHNGISSAIPWVWLIFLYDKLLQFLLTYFLVSQHSQLHSNYLICFPTRAIYNTPGFLHCILQFSDIFPSVISVCIM